MGKYWLEAHMYISPDEAARALDEVRRTQRSALRSAPPMFPSWYLVAVWGFVAGVQFVTEVLPAWGSAIGLPLLLAGLTAAVIKFVRDVRNLALRPHSSVVDPWAWAAFAVWLVFSIAGSLAVAFLFEELGIAYPRTAAGAVCLAIVALTAPALPRWMSARTARRLETTSR